MILRNSFRYVLDVRCTLVNSALDAGGWMLTDPNENILSDEEK